MALTAGDSWLEKGANLLLFGPDPLGHRATTRRVDFLRPFLPAASSYFFLRIRVFLLLVLAIGLDFDLEEVGLITLMSSGAIGEPRPVHASQPAPAAKLPLFPWIMSRKAALPLA
jgi:hypothetical protein